MDWPTITRRRLIAAAAGSLAAWSWPNVLGADAPPVQSSTPPAKKAAKPPALAPELVREFVGAGHGDRDKTERMLAEHPGLLNATWDWGGGDFETAIGGAGHMGRADIAQYLIAQGARFDIFVAAMLGRLDLVKPVLTAFPNLRHSKGPHGISLEQHARQGKDAAAPVLEYLLSLD